MKNRQIAILVLIMVCALALRIYFIPAKGYENDIHNFKVWSRIGVEQGVHNIYDKSSQYENNWCDYPPAYLYVLKAVGSVYRFFSPNFEENTYLFDLLIKLPAILADLLTTLIIFFLLLRTGSFQTAVLGMAAYAFNPFIFFNSAYWGQVDSFPTLIILLSILALVNKKYGWSWMLFTLTVLLKTQYAIVLPILATVTWREKGLQGFLSGLAISWFTWVAVLAEFYYFHKVDRVIDKIVSAVGRYPFLSLNAFNLWWLLFGRSARTLLDTETIAGFMSYRSVGVLLFMFVLAIIIVDLLGRKNDEKNILASCAITFFAFSMLPTEMHERYIFPVFVFLLLIAIKSNGDKVVYGLLSAAAFINLYMVLSWVYPKNVLLISFFDLYKIDMVISGVNLAILAYFLYRSIKTMRKRYLVYIMIVVVGALAGIFLLRGRGPEYLSDRQEKTFSQQWGKLMKNRSVDGNTLTVNGFMFSKGLGTHANSSIVYDLNGRFNYIEGSVGLDDEQNRGNKTQFLLFADGKQIFDTGIIQGWIKPIYFKVPIKSAKEIRLEVRDGGDGINFDHADWLDIKVIP